MTITIAGYGFVGKAHHHVFKNLDLEIVDPAYSAKQLSEIENLSAVICCVSTPMSPNGDCDYSNIIDVLEQTPAHVPVLIKSTFCLNGWQTIQSLFPDHSVNFSPEFLSAHSANQDMEQLKFLIMSQGAHDYFWIDVYQSAYANKLEIYQCSIEEAITIKYFENAFLATKVSFFNQIYDFCQAFDINYEKVRCGLGLDTRINLSHTLVNPEVGQRGWGGHCFPKDTSSLINVAKNAAVDLSVLQTAVQYNQKIRNGLSNLK